MPRLPDETALGLRPTPQPATGIALADTSAIGKGLQTLGTGITAIGEEQQKQQDEQAIFQQRRGLVDVEASIKQDALSKKGADAFNLPQQISKSYDDYVNQAAAALPNKAQRLAFQNTALSRKLNLVDWATTYAAGQKKEYDADSFNADLASMQTDAANNAANPHSVITNLDLIAHRAQSYLQSIGAPQSQIDQVTTEAQGKLVFGVAENLLVAGDYKGAQANVERYKDVLTPTQQYGLGNKIDEYVAPDIGQQIYAKHGGDLNASINEAHNTIDKLSLRNGVQNWIRQQYNIDSTQRMQNRIDVQDRYQEAAQSLLQFGTYHGQMPTHSELVSALGPDKGDTAFDDLQAMQKVGGDIQAIRTMTPEQQDALLKTYEPKPDNNVIEANQRYKYLASAIDMVNKQRTADPAAYVQSINPDVQASYQRVTQVLSDPVATPDQKQQAADDYAGKTIAAQRVIGIQNPSIVPRGYQDWLTGQFDPSKGEDTAKLLQSQSDTWGKYWPQVYGQVQKDIPAVAKVIGSGMPAPAAAYLSELSKIEPDEFKASVPADASKKIDKKAQSALAPFFATTAWNVGGGVQTNQAIESATKTLANGYVLRGDDADTALKKAANDVVLGRYTFTPNYRVPSQFDANAVSRGAKATVSALTADDIALPGKPEDAASYLHSYKQNSVWVTNSDESGLTLINPDTKSAVIDRKGQPISRTWQQLTVPQKQQDEAIRLPGLPGAM